MDHLATIRSPAYVDLVRQQLAIEQARQAELLARKRTLEENIKRLHADGCELLHNFTKRVCSAFISRYEADLLLLNARLFWSHESTTTADRDCCK